MVLLKWQGKLEEEEEEEEEEEGGCDLASLFYPFNAVVLFYMTNWVEARTGSRVKIQF